MVAICGMKKIILKSIGFILLFFWACISCVHADYIDRETILITQKIIDIKKLDKEQGSITIAVIPFENNSTDLRQRNIGLGTSELLTSALVTHGKGHITVIERRQLEKVFTEQKLSLTGITEVNARGIGNLLAAEYLILGKVSKSYEKYSIRMKVVNTETGVIAVTHMVEFAINDFENNSIVKKVVVPRKDSIGIYLGYKIIPIKTEFSPPVLGRKDTQYEFTGTTVESENLSLVGIGNKFYVTETLMGDIFLGTVVTSNRFSWEIRDVRGYPSPPGDKFGKIELFDFAFTINKAFPLKSWFDVYLGAGFEYLVINNMNFNAASLVPTVRTGFECRIFNKVGLSVFGQYFRVSDEVKSDGRPDTVTPLLKFKYGTNSILSAVTFYF